MKVTKINDKEMFWKSVKLRSPKKWKTEITTILTKGNAIMKNKKLITNTFNNY